MGHGGMSCGMKTVRLIMVLFNSVFFLLGALLLALGIYAMIDVKLQTVKELLLANSNPALEQGISYLEVMAIGIIVLGSILLIVGFLGCCGAMKQVKLFLTCYAMVLGTIILLEIGVTIYFVVFHIDFKDKMVPKLKQSLNSTYEGPLGLVNDSQDKPSSISLAWDLVMWNFNCCGVDGKEDFANVIKWNRSNPRWNSSMPSTFKTFKYPLTCCPLPRSQREWSELPLQNLEKAFDCALTGTGVYETGCYDILVDLVSSTKTFVTIDAAIILIVQLLAFIFTLALCCREKKDTIYYSS